MTGPLISEADYLNALIAGQPGAPCGNPACSAVAYDAVERDRHRDGGGLAH